MMVTSKLIQELINSAVESYRAELEAAIAGDTELADMATHNRQTIELMLFNKPKQQPQGE